MGEYEQIDKFLCALLELEDAIVKTLKVGVEYGLIKSIGVENTLSFYRLVVATISKYTKKPKSED